MIRPSFSLTASLTATLALVAALGSSACFEPIYIEGIRCSLQNTCPGDLICDTRDRICHAAVTPMCTRDEDCPGGTCDLEQDMCIPAQCGDGIVDSAAGEVCEPSLDPCCNAACSGPAVSGTTCRDAVGDCDAAELCDGVATACPVDQAVLDGSACEDCSDGVGLCDQCAAGACTNLCGNGALDDAVGEQCDSAVLDSGACPGFCQSDCACAFPASCLDYLGTTPGLPDGTYTIDPDGPGGLPPFDVVCDMSAGGFTRLLFWDRESDPANHTLASLQAALIDEIAMAADPDVSPMTSVIDEANRIRWSDVNGTYDALSYRLDVPFANNGELRADIHYEGWSMEASAIWFFAEAGGAPQDVLCWSDAAVGYSAAELALIPYTCPLGVPDGISFTWNSVEQRDLGASINSVHMRSLHADTNGDFSYLYRLAVWVR